MPTKTEQIDACHNIIIDYDEPLSNSNLFNCLAKILGDSLKKKEISGRQVFTYKNSHGKSTVLLCKNITYLGNPHPIFKKRIQLSDWFKEFCLLNKELDIRYLGVYHYKGLFIFVDFDKTNYISKKSHNSSAHVYSNDLYQALVHGIFCKVDANGNNITSISCRHLKNYLDGKTVNNEIFDVFDMFNKKFTWDSWITAKSAITEMYQNGWSQWRQTEWCGWYLEYLVNSFIIDNNVSAVIVYTGLSHKKQKDLDFDLYFPKQKFQGDLKASDISQKETPGNDQTSLIDSINQNGRFWYVIYEHETKKDKDCLGHPATKFRNELIYKNDNILKSPTSYLSKMKHSVKFKQMMILEINRINYWQLLKTFNQGHQPDGSPRAPKFNINKKSSVLENFVVYRYKSNT